MNTKKILGKSQEKGEGNDEEKITGYCNRKKNVLFSTRKRPGNKKHDENTDGKQRATKYCK